MTKFIISASLDENKSLQLHNVPNQNQGEGNSTEIQLSVPQAMAEGMDFYLEFLCPQNKRYVSPRLNKAAASQGSALLSCAVPSCVLQSFGFVKLQLVATDAVDNSIAYKSNLSNRASFFVRPSINATPPTEHGIFTGSGAQ